MKRGVWLIVGGAFVCAVAIGGLYFALDLDGQTPDHRCNFSDNLREASGGRALYCPDATRLLSGVTSKEQDATFGEGAVVYSISDGSSNIAVSLQDKPDKDKLTNFVTNVIPLHFDVETPVGKAQTGVSQGHSLTSLPTNTSTWILLTAPQEYDIDRLTEILKTFQAD